MNSSYLNFFENVNVYVYKHIYSKYIGMASEGQMSLFQD